MKTDTVSCLILAGGQSKRMNHEDKGLVKFNGRPLIEHVVNALHNQIDDFVISANRNIQSYQRLTSIVIPDNGSKNGPLAGIVAAAPACRHEQVLVVPCDMPYLPNNLVKSLLSASKSRDIAIVRVQNRLQLVFLMRKSLLVSAQEHLSSGRFKLMQWIENCSPAVVDYNDSADAFININSVEQLE